MTTKAIEIQTTHGVIHLPAGLRVKPAPSFQLCPTPGLYVLDEFPFEHFPEKSIFRSHAMNGEIYLNQNQVNF